MAEWLHILDRMENNCLILAYLSNAPEASTQYCKALLGNIKVVQTEAESRPCFIQLWVWRAGRVATAISVHRRRERPLVK